ncbi:7sk snrna methylphosphate capping enzyme [Stylonychia lemnae]|uniref:RNA methyltransferase n=1 Tax=Stylonychia lemnae TaxID=5949 RepID=A0A077ZU81_STYLE|nr:7sk snrna methylphosphate capping enzyme [Stylonychia lemnae]|eukprot:CDW72845.1 7sk snrna methylphosphate capping enzyme [Stylonychia lemnae]
MESSKKEENKSTSKIDLHHVENSKKRKRNDLKGPAGYGIPDNTKKIKIDDLNDSDSKPKSGLPANSNILVKFPLIIILQQQQEISKILEGHETIYKDVLANNKPFFQQLKDEQFNNQLQRDIKHQSLGNHDKFRQFHNSAQKWQDQRLSHFKDEWLRDKKVLDIGCGDGLVDILVAVNYEPKLIIGIDIDHRQTKKAITNMQKTINDQEQLDALMITMKLHNEDLNKGDAEMIDQLEEKKRKLIKEKKQKYEQILERVKNLPISLQLTFEGELARLKKDQGNFLTEVINSENPNPSLKDVKNYLYGKICFRTENYIENTILSQKEKFDTILCLSTIKYVHLNFGDLGVKTLFSKVYDQLLPDGIFILENQLWKSYKKHKNTNERSKANYNSIKIRPHCFRAYLEKVGFELVISIMPSEEDSKKGFDRPIMVFKKLK